MTLRAGTHADTPARLIGGIAFHTALHESDECGAVSDGTNSQVNRRRAVVHSTSEFLPFGECARLIYVWSPSMPLSRRGMSSIRDAAKHLGLPLTVVRASSLYQQRDANSRSGLEFRGSGSPAAPADDALINTIIAAGATTHYPSVIILRDGRIVGNALLGYKTAETYERMIEERIRTDIADDFGSTTRLAIIGRNAERHLPVRTMAIPFGDSQRALGNWWKDFPVEGRAGAYFRSVPGRNAIAFESEQVIYLLHLADGSSTVAPGFVDFVPTPDGLYFVTPGPGRSGLQFFDADRVFEGPRGEPGTEVPIYVDPGMRDQYPSVGILLTDGSDAAPSVYRVLTSWYDRAVFRDYEIRPGVDGRQPVVRPAGDPVIACPGYQISIPILSSDGSTIAARDERTATTKLFKLDNGGNCEEVLDLQIQTGKVAFGPDGRRIAFAIPPGAVRVRRDLRSSGSNEVLDPAGIFVLDLNTLRFSRVLASEELNRLAFPDFIGRDSIVFLIGGRRRSEGDRFRVVCCLR